MNIFKKDFPTVKELMITEGSPIKVVARTIHSNVSAEARKKGENKHKGAQRRKNSQKFIHKKSFIFVFFLLL